MASTSFPPKSVAVDPYASSSSSTPAPTSKGSIFSRFAQWRTNLGLSAPGNIESMSKEAKATQLTYLMFDGARADLAKGMSMNPLFQVTHSFALGSATQPPSYNFGAMFANDKFFLQGRVDHDGNVSSHWNQTWSPRNVSKMQTQSSASGIPGHSVCVLEHDYQGQDYNLNAKVNNPWPSDLSGTYVFGYLQSLTKNLALGGEYMVNRTPGAPSHTAGSLVGKLTATDKSWIASATVLPDLTVNATYWQKLSEKVDVAAELVMSPSGMRREGLASLAAKYDLRMATFRAQLDSAGKVSAILEQRFTPAFAFILNGEIDHFKNSAKFGLGVQIESSSLTPEEMEAQINMPPSL